MYIYFPRQKVKIQYIVQGLFLATFTVTAELLNPWPIQIYLLLKALTLNGTNPKQMLFNK